MRKALKSVVARLGDLSKPGAVEFADEATGSFARELPRVDLRIKSLIRYGEDEKRIPDGQPIAYVSGQRRFTLGIRVESDIGSSGEALRIASDVQSRLGREAVTAELRKAGMALAGGNDITLFDYKRDGRNVNVAAFDVFMNCAENNVDLEGGGIIETAEIASEYLTRPDGEQSKQITLVVEGNP